jgi:acyl-coenzyme A synthetase/AMP-(fatty) acid ligase
VRDKGRIIAVFEVPRQLLWDVRELRRLSQSYRCGVQARKGATPTDCWFVPAGHLPCTENGKVRRASLRAWIDDGHFIPAWTDTRDAFDRNLGVEHEIDCRAGS